MRSCRRAVNQEPNTAPMRPKPAPMATDWMFPTVSSPRHTANSRLQKPSRLPNPMSTLTHQGFGDPNLAHRGVRGNGALPDGCGPVSHAARHVAGPVRVAAPRRQCVRAAVLSGCRADRFRWVDTRAALSRGLGGGSRPARARFRTLTAPDRWLQWTRSSRGLCHRVTVGGVAASRRSAGRFLPRARRRVMHERVRGPGDERFAHLGPSLGSAPANDAALGRVSGRGQ